MAKRVEAINFSVGFSFERETPGTYRFMENGDKETHRIGTLYVKKSAFPKGAPKGLRVSVEEVK